MTNQHTHPLRLLAENGGTFVKVVARQKKPLENDWQSRPYTLDAITAHINGGGNVGLLTGNHSDGLCALDLDRDFDAFCQRNPRWAASLQIVRADAPDRGKIVVRVKGSIPPSGAWKREGDKSPSCEWLAGGRQAVVPSSIHPSGALYELRNGDQPILEVTAEEVAAVWANLTGEDLMPRPSQTRQQTSPRTARPHDDLLTRVKTAWPSALAVFQYHGLGQQLEKAGRGNIRLTGNGGLICGTGNAAWRWFNHSDQIGGDQIDAWGYAIHGTRWNHDDPVLFMEVLTEMAQAAGITVHELQPTARSSDAPNPRERIDAALIKAKETLDPGIPFEIAAELALLPPPDLERTLNAFKETLGRRLHLGNLRKQVRDKQRQARPARTATKAAEEPTNRPTIVVNDRQLRDVTKESMRALEAANSPPTIYRRGTGLARIRRDDDARPLIEQLSETQVRNQLTLVANYFREDPDTSVLVAVYPEREIAQDILACRELPFPRLVQVVETPVLRPDGTVLCQPGYDAATGLFYEPAPGLDVPPIPDVPTAEQVAEAVVLLSETFGDFPFDSQASYANAVALTLTALVRSALGGNAPMGCVDGSKMGNGKTLLTEVVAEVTTGRPAALMSSVGDDQEWRKQITSALLDGDSYIVIDNAEGVLFAPSLAKALTARVWKDRRLGFSQSLELPQRATWVVTGNNIRLGGDLPRRCYWIRLDAKMARPWERSGFRHPELLLWVGRNRGRLIAALLTMARAWYAAGQPAADTPKLGNFEGWVRIVGGILTHCGIEGFLGNQGELYERLAGAEKEWETFLDAWENCIGDRDVMTGDVADMLRRSEGQALKAALPTTKLVEALETDKPGSFNRKLGNALAAKVDVRFGPRNLHITRLRNDSRSGQPVWRLSGDPNEIVL